MDLNLIREKWVIRSFDVAAETAAWDSTAEEYLFEEKNSLENDPFLHFITGKTTLTKDMCTLDVGCGAGAYSVALAEKVGQADGVDLSPRMVELGNAYAESHGIDNLRLRVCNWHSCDSAEFQGRYDLVFAHTTPAVADYRTLVKLCEASKGCCFLCIPSRRTDLVFDELRSLAGIPPIRKGDDSVAYAFDTLWGLGYEPELGYTKTQWLPRRTPEEAEKWYLGRLRGRQEMSAETERRIRCRLRELAVDGYVQEQIDTTLVNFYWRTAR